jgi:electron transport complex protein RnfG
MNETGRMILVLTVISAASALLLAATNTFTREPIARALKAEKLDALRQVLPPYDNQPDADTVVVESGGTVWTACVARVQGRFAGCAFETHSDAGYSGRIVLLVGLRPDGSVHGLRALKQNETPGLGAKIAATNEPFMRQFAGRSLASAAWKVGKDGGDFDAITGATITSRAVLEAVCRALEAYQAGRARIEAAAP